MIRGVMFFAIVLHLTVAFARAAGEEAVPPTPQWLREITRVAYTDLPNRNGQEDWPDKLIADLGKAKVQLLFSRAHSGESWPGLGWKSAYGEPDPAMKGGDGTRQVVDLCRKHGLRYIAYYWAQREHPSLAEAHPDWRCVSSAGKATAYLCINTPYRKLVEERIVELVAKVGVDGIFFDMFHTRGNECYCAACKEAFRRVSGQAPPVKEDYDSLLWQQWVDFKYRSIENALREYNRAIKTANPQAALVVNTWNAWVYNHSHNTRNSIRVAECVDGILEETGWYDTVDPSFFAFPTLHNFMSWHLAGLAKDKPAFMWSSPTYARTKPIGLTEAMIRIGCMMTNGAVPAQSVPGRDVAAAYFGEIAARDTYFRGGRLVPWCGLVVSEKSEQRYGRNEIKNRYLKGVYGAYQILLERHLPVSLVTDRDLERGRLDRFRVLFLANCAALAPGEMETLRAFVREGGGLVATYETSLYDGHGRLQANFGLADLLGAKKVGEFDNRAIRIGWDPTKTHTANLYVPKDHRWAAAPGIRESMSRRNATQPEGTLLQHFTLYGRLLEVEPLQGRPDPIRLTTARYDDKTKQIVRTNHAGVVVQMYGKGRVIYFPADLTWTYFRLGEPHIAALVEHALREAAGSPPPVDVAAPSIVQAMAQQQDRRLVVHLLNDISSLGRSQNVPGESLRERTEVIPIHGISLTFADRSLRKFTLLPGGQRLEAIASAKGVTVRLPPLEIHAMVVAEGE